MSSKTESQDNKIKDNQLENVSGGIGSKELDDSDLVKVAGGFEVTVPFKEFIESNLQADKRTDENSSKKNRNQSKNKL